MGETTLLTSQRFGMAITRLCYQLIENYGDFRGTAIIGLQPRGGIFARRLYNKLREMQPACRVGLGIVDPTFHRDDFRRRKEVLLPSHEEINFSVEDKQVVLVDDVLYTGRTIRAGMEALLDYGRPARIELLVMVDRRYSRQLPIEPDYVGLAVDTRASQRVAVRWQENEGEDTVVLKQQ